MKYYRDISHKYLLKITQLSGNTIELYRMSDVERICTNGASTTSVIGPGISFPKSSIKSIEFGEGYNKFDYIPEYLGYNFVNMSYINEIPNHIKTIGNNFIYFCDVLNVDIKIPDALTSLNTSFCFMDTFNGNFIFNNNLQEITSSIEILDVFNKPIDLSNTKVNKIDGSFYNLPKFNSEFKFPNTLKILGNNFFSGNSIFNQQITIPSSVTEIGYNFMGSCSVFNQPLTIPSSVSKIKYNFLYGLNNFKGPLILYPSFIDNEFDMMNRNETLDYFFSVTSSTAPAYVYRLHIQGIPDERKDEFKTLFPNLNGYSINNTKLYRKLILD